MLIAPKQMSEIRTRLFVPIRLFGRCMYNLYGYLAGACTIFTYSEDYNSFAAKFHVKVRTF